jgi:hypothetical protein
MPICEEHSVVMKCLGALEQGQSDIKGTLTTMNNSLVEIKTLQNNGVVKVAVEKTKATILYWVIAITIGGLIVGLINTGLRAFTK